MHSQPSPATIEQLHGATRGPHKVSVIRDIVLPGQGNLRELPLNRRLFRRQCDVTVRRTAVPHDVTYVSHTYVVWRAVIVAMTSRRVTGNGLTNVPENAQEKFH